MLPQSTFRFDPIPHRYYYGDRRIVGITEAIQSVGLSPAIPESARRNFAYAASRGTTVHKACELSDLGQSHEYDMDSNLSGYVKAWEKFRIDYGYEPDLVEVPLGHYIYQFGGTPDTAGYSKKLEAYCVVERKTCQLQDHFGFQLAGQEILVIQGPSGPQHARKLAVQLKPDSQYVVKEYYDKIYHKLFLNAVSISNWKISHRDK